MFQLLLGFQKNENVPSFKFLHNENKSSDPRQNIPQFMITFPDGENTTTNLSYFNAFPYFNTSKPCQYLGNLNNDLKTSLISASGCLHLKTGNENFSDEEMYFTLFSDKLPNSYFFKLNGKGEVKEIVSDGLDDATMEFENEYLEPSNYNYSLSKVDDFFDYQEKEREQIRAELRMNIAFGVDRSIKEALGSKNDIENWIGDVIVHMQAFYHHPSFKTRLNFEVIFSFIFIEIDFIV